MSIKAHCGDIMEFFDTTVHGLEAAFVGMRLPMCLSLEEAVQKSQLDKDLLLVNKLINADKSYCSQPNSKCLRMIHVQVCISAPMYWWSEFDTYKVGVTRNSSSFMHKGTSREFTLDDFELDTESMDYTVAENNPFYLSMAHTIKSLNIIRGLYIKTKDIKYFRQLRQMLPSSYKYVAMVDLNYAVLRTMIQQRSHHRLKEWREDFINWCKTLPYAEQLLFSQGETK